MMNAVTYSPLSDAELSALEGKFRDEAAAQPLVALDAVKRFPGAGVYMLYYSGNHPAYADLPADVPLYVGKAIFSGGRKGLAVTEQGTPLYSRLRQHRSSVQAATNLDAADFSCRWLALHTLWVGLAESMLISHWQPVWNAVLDGFGNHDPGVNRRGGLVSKWDTLHPGRPWVADGAVRIESADDLQTEVQTHFRA